MILPDGYSDVPAGKIAAVVTHLEMTARPAPRPDPAGAWTLRRVEVPPLDWYRDLYRRVGGNGCGSRGYGCPTRNWPRSFNRRRWRSTRWRMRDATKACSRWIFASPGNAKSSLSGSPKNLSEPAPAAG